MSTMGLRRCPVVRIHIRVVQREVDLTGNFVWLPLLNMFRNRELEFGFSLQNIKTVFEAFQIQPALA